LSYFNTLLFPLAASARLKDRLFDATRASGTAMPPRALNALFHRLFSVERVLVGRLPLPFGVSIVCVLR
jgi:hypothetical protein